MRIQAPSYHSRELRGVEKAHRIGVGAPEAVVMWCDNSCDHQMKAIKHAVLLLITLQKVVVLNAKL